MKDAIEANKRGASVVLVLRHGYVTIVQITDCYHCSTI